MKDRQWLDTEKTALAKKKKLVFLQGPVTSTSFFSIYISDLPNKVKSVQVVEGDMFADDMLIWTSAKNNVKQLNMLETKNNSALELLSSWAEDNNMEISKTKTIYQLLLL